MNLLFAKLNPSRNKLFSLIRENKSSRKRFFCQFVKFLTFLLQILSTFSKFIQMNEFKGKLSKKMLEKKENLIILQEKVCFCFSARRADE